MIQRSVDLRLLEISLKILVSTFERLLFYVSKRFCFFFKYLSVGMWLTGLPMDIIIRAHVVPTKAAEFETTLILKY